MSLARHPAYYPNMGAKYPPVRLDIPPHYAQLHRWGRDARGQWHALIGWTEHIQNSDHPDAHGRPLTMSAWTLASHLQRESGQDYDGITRIELAADPSSWPSIRGGGVGYWSDEGWHVDPIDGADPLPKPFQRVGGQGNGE